jgi:hypothetical protein
MLKKRNPIYEKIGFFLLSSFSQLFVMNTHQDLQNSIHLLNDFCADTENFSFSRLAHFKLKGVPLHVNAALQELTMVVSSEEDYYILVRHLTVGNRLYQLLELHFKKVHIVFGIPNDSIENSIHLKTIFLEKKADSIDLRDYESIGARLRRALNVVLQGHLVELWLYDENDRIHFKKLWKRRRMIELVQQHHIMHSYEINGKLVKLWKSKNSDDNDSVSITIK